MQLETWQVNSLLLHREVRVDVYLPARPLAALLLVNDGQDMPALPADMPAVCVAAIHAGPLRRQEYGTAGVIDYQGQGRLAGVYTRFVRKELLPFLEERYPALQDLKRACAGFSLGGLSALDIVWNHPEIFGLAGVFSGALWWRNRPLGQGYSDAANRIMHRRIREGRYHPGLQFFFECGTADETADRNGNGIIDSIDDTKDLIQELVNKGYHPEKDITYLEIPGGRHDQLTWQTAMAAFLRHPFFI
ncbi:alpha/beta hydrolase [Chitinophaga solisilvae]|uniref:alpha/beta hydrolase n=1 Tax=Chitinophaga solisilvae TaxID=1233460 RepID=UPI00136BC3CC|nr:alpha/beta hydrolase-fold protein [Chitinophaga solisilvae]